jgi:hypothetical protein
MAWQTPAVCADILPLPETEATIVGNRHRLVDRAAYVHGSFSCYRSAALRPRSQAKSGPITGATDQRKQPIRESTTGGSKGGLSATTFLAFPHRKTSCLRDSESKRRRFAILLQHRKLPLLQPLPLEATDQINWAARERCVARASDHHQHAFGPRPSNLNTFLTALFDPAIFLNSVFARARPGGCPWYPVGRIAPLA